MDDLIGRQAAIDEANAWLLDCFNVGKQDRSCGLIRRLEDLPSAQPEEPSYDAVKEYCRKRCLSIVDTALLGKYTPSAQPRWIPCSERAPETIINEHTHDYQEYNCLCDFGDHGFDVRTYKFGNGHFWNGGGLVDKYVIAWMPLPAPYRSEGEKK